MTVKIDPSLVGKTIKELRLRKNLTQEALADNMYLSTRNLRRIENQGTTSIAVVNEFAEYFEVSALDILNGDVL